MKETVVDLNDLKAMAPFFGTAVGRAVGKGLLHFLEIDKVNQAHANSCHLRGAAFTHSLLRDPLIDIRYNLHHAERLDALPEGAFITVSNHPIGSLDGIMLIDIVAARRPDFKVMVNGILSKIGAMTDNFISVQPDTKHEGRGNRANMGGVRLCLQHLQAGHPMGFFPAGAMSFYNKEAKAVRDLPWTRSVVRLIHRAGVPVYPIYFDFLNTPFFYWLGNVSWQLRTLRVVHEIFNKRGRTVDVYVGNPIPAEQIAAFADDDALGKYLYEQTYACKSNG